MEHKKRKIESESSHQIIKKFGEKFPKVEKYIWYFIQKSEAPVTTRNLIDLILCENQNEDEKQLIASLIQHPTEIIPKRKDEINFDEINQVVKSPYNLKVKPEEHINSMIIYT